MRELVHIQNSDITVKEYRGQKVVTFKDIDMVHERPDGTARATFNRNKDRFKEGEDYFVCETYEAKKLFNVSAPNGICLLTEQGYLMLVKPFSDDLSWKVQRELVTSYFRVRQITNEELSPQTQLILQLAQSIANKELEDKERDRQIAIAKETADKAIETTENIKEAVKPVFDNWRSEINAKFNRIQKNAGSGFQMLRSQMYMELEQRAGCDLNSRLRNKRNRMADSGCTKTMINALNKMDIINEDKKLREIFSKIVTEYEIKYCA
mgnify:CR=1 FL=1